MGFCGSCQTAHRWIRHWCTSFLCLKRWLKYIFIIFLRIWHKEYQRLRSIQFHHRIVRSCEAVQYILKNPICYGTLERIMNVKYIFIFHPIFHSYKNTNHNKKKKKHTLLYTRLFMRNRSRFVKMYYWPTTCYLPLNFKTVVIIVKI